MSYVIATLDLESYSLKSNAAIAEVAIVTYDIGMRKHYQNIPEDFRFDDPKVSHINLSFPLLEQICLGQDVDPQTIKFHAKQQDKRYLGNLLFPDLDTEPLDCGSCLSLLSAFVAKEKVKELWINHTNFDGPMLKVLAEKVGDKLWSHYLEYDLYPFRKIFDLKTGNDGKSNHRAIGDCLWNMQVLRALGQFITYDLKDPSLIRAEHYPAVEKAETREYVSTFVGTDGTPIPPLDKMVEDPAPTESPDEEPSETPPLES